MLEANSPSQALLTGASHATLPEVSEVLESKQEEDRTCRGKLLALWRQLTWERCQVGVVFMLFVVCSVPFQQLLANWVHVVQYRHVFAAVVHYVSHVAKRWRCCIEAAEQVVEL